MTLPDQARVIQGLQREDLFTVVFDQVMTDSALYADVVLPATTFLEHYDYAKGYGALSLQLGRPVIEAVGESRSNTDVFMDLVRRMDLSRDGDPEDDIEAMLTSLAGHARRDRRRAARALARDTALRRAAGAVRRCHAEDGGRARSTCARRRSTPRRRSGLYGYQADPGTERYPLALISPASERTVSSTLGELTRPDVIVEINPTDAEARQHRRSRRGADIQRSG